MQIKDLSQQDDIKNTTASYFDWSQKEIVREIKEDFLNISEDPLQQKLSDA